jgi:hypothetical protein
MLGSVDNAIDSAEHLARLEANISLLDSIWRIYFNG